MRFGKAASWKTDEEVRMMEPLRGSRTNGTTARGKMIMAKLCRHFDFFQRNIETRFVSLAVFLVEHSSVKRFPFSAVFQPIPTTSHFPEAALFFLLLFRKKIFEQLLNNALYGKTCLHNKKI